MLTIDSVVCVAYSDDTLYVLTHYCRDLSFYFNSYLSIGHLYGAVSNLMDTQADPNTSVQTAQSATNQTTTHQTTADRMEKNKYKIPILSDKKTDLTKINPRMWWEQISEYIHLTYNRNLDEMVHQGTDQMDQHTVYHIKGDVICA